VATTQQYMPSALATPDAVNLESLNVAPGVVSAGLAPGYASTATLMPSTYGAVTPDYTVGSGTGAACMAPSTISPGSLPPQVVRNTALEYANAAPSTDVILHPTPLGTQEIDQLRDASAPETMSYQVALQPGQYLQQLDSGSIAIIDPSVPTISSTLPPELPELDPVASDPGTSADTMTTDPAQDLSTWTAQDLAGVLPVDEDILPSQTQFQYEAEDQLNNFADQDADGQAVAIITPPWAKDASGVGVPVDMAITAPNTVAVTTHHHAATYAYPVMTSHKTTTTSKHRRKPANRQLDAQNLEGLTAASPKPSKNPDGSTDGAHRLGSQLHIHKFRTAMYYQDSCDKYDQDPKKVNNMVSQSDANVPQPPGKKPPCSTAAKIVKQMYLSAGGNKDDYSGGGSGLPPGSQLYVTLVPSDPANPKPHAYARSISRLWKVYPFNKVNFWGPTNEPDGGTPAFHIPNAQKAADIWRFTQDKARRGSRGNGLCPTCTIVAGEFTTNPSKYANDYMTYLADQKNGKYHPMYWAMHDYGDVSNGKNHQKLRNYPYVKQFINTVKKYFPGKRRRIELSEQGLLLSYSNRGTTTFIDGDKGLQDYYAKRFRRLNGVDRQIDIVGLYMLFGDYKFDSGLFEPPGPVATLPGDTTSAPAYFHFRVGYCELANRPLGPCVAGTGASKP